MDESNQPKKDEVVDALLAAWDRHPDWRLGQLIDNAVSVRRYTLYYVPDFCLIDALKDLT